RLRIERCGRSQCTPPRIAETDLLRETYTLFEQFVVLVRQRDGARLTVAGVFDRIQPSSHPVVFELEPGSRGAAILGNAEDRRESARLDQLDQPRASGAGASRLGQPDGAFEERQLRGEVLAVE